MPGIRGPLKYRACGSTLRGVKNPSPLALLYLLAALPLRAAQVLKVPDCVPFPDKGCYYDPGIKAAEAPLLIYLRGHLGGAGVITGQDAVLASARQAFEKYGLRSAAQAQGLVVLVTGSSHLAVLRDDVARLEGLLGRRVGSVAVAAHSGGYVGLSKSLDSLQRVDRVVLLDNFYGDVAGMAGKVARAGAPCSGFYTPHNRARFKNFTGAACAIEAAASDAEHDPRVGKCLPSYLAGEACDGKGPARRIAARAADLPKTELGEADHTVSVLGRTKDIFGPERKDEGAGGTASWLEGRREAAPPSVQEPGAKTLAVKKVPELGAVRAGPANGTASGGWWSALLSRFHGESLTPIEKWQKRLGEEARRWLDSGKEDSPAFPEAMNEAAAELERAALAERKAERGDEAFELEFLAQKARRAAAGDHGAFADLAAY